MRAFSKSRAKPNLRSKVFPQFKKPFAHARFHWFEKQDSATAAAPW
jgi:hypothetical protein